MSSQLRVERFKNICPDKWVAQAYGEYLSDCASLQAELLAAYSEGIADETIESLIDSKSDALTSLEQSIESDVLGDLVQNGLSAVPDDILFTESYVEAFESKYSTDGQFKLKVDSLHTEFPQIPEVTAEFSAGDLAEWLANNPIPSILESDDDIKDAVNSYVSGVLSTHRWRPETPYTMNDSYIPIGDMLSSMIIKASTGSENPLNQGFCDVDGAAITMEYSVDQIVDQIKTNFTSTTAWSQGFLAMVHDNAQDAINQFEAAMSTIVSDVHEKFAATVNQVKSTIASTKANISSFISACDEFFGFSKIAEETFTTVDDTEIFNYTGASPLAGINLKSVQGVVAVTGKVVAAVAVVAWTGIKNIAKKIWRKVSPIVKAITNDPIDIEIGDSQDKHYGMSNFFYKGKSLSTTIGFSSDSAVHYYTDQEVQTMQNAINGAIGNWYAVDTYFFSFMFKITAGNVTVNAARTNYQITDFQYEYQLKPKALDPDVLLNYNLVQHTHLNPGTGVNEFVVAQTTLGSSADAWTRFSEYLELGDDIYIDDVSKEPKMWCGFLLSLLVGSEALRYATDDLVDSFQEKYDFKPTIMVGRFEDGNTYTVPSTTTYHFRNAGTIYPNWSTFSINAPVIKGIISNRLVNQDDDPTKLYPAHVTNADFIVAGCGPRFFDDWPVYDQNYQNQIDLRFSNVEAFHTLDLTQPIAPQRKIINVASVILPFIMAFIMQRYDRELFPGDYAFLPYCKNSYSFFDGGRYHIKTDAQNRNIAQVMINAIVLIAVVVAAVLICGSIIKIFKLKKMSKLQTKIGVVDNATWNGKKLTVGEQIKYQRWSKKMNKLQGASSGLAGGETTTSLLKEGIASVSGKVSQQIDIPKSVAQGEIVERNQEILENCSTSDQFNQIKTIIVGTI